MNMIETQRYTVTAANCDADGFWTISDMAHQVGSSATLRNKMEGGSRQKLQAQLHAVWMFRRIRLEQFSPVREGDELIGYGSSRTVHQRTYSQLGEMYRGDELVAKLSLMMMPVLLRGRRRLTCQDTEPLFDVPPLNEVPSFETLETIEPFVYDAEKTITAADCDSNAAHFAFFDYASLVTAMTGYSAIKPHPVIASMQIDYIKECVNGNTIKMGAQPQGAGFAVQAQHTDGHPCFNAYIEYK
jgi:hypothetical protein